MILSLRTNAPRWIVAFSLLCLSDSTCIVESLQAEQQSTTATSPVAWHSDQATLLTELAEVKADTKGSLSLSSAALVFTAPEGSTLIDRAGIATVTAGNVRVETGGTAGKITRAVIPFGGGAAVATVTNKQVDLLTVEFRDEHNALHGAVFLLPKNEAMLARQQFGQVELLTPLEHSKASCTTVGSVQANAIELAPIATLGDPVPAEYRVLLYEQLLQRLQRQSTFAGIFRDGDNSAASTCPAYTLTLTLGSFKKGNAALRASTGPVGLFVGATSFKFHALVRGQNGKTLLDRDFKVSKRGDSDSLDVTDKIAKLVCKQLNETNRHTARS